MSRYRWALRPAWIVSHLFVLLCVLTFVRLGFWQLSRLQERRAQNTLVESRQSGPATALDQVLAPDAGPAAVDGAIYRRASVTGTYLVEDQVLVRNQSFQGSPGFWVVTPLALADGHAVAINRGWVPLTTGEGDPAAFRPPAGPVTVTGVVERSQSREGLGVADPETGRLAELGRVDLDRLQKQVSTRLYPVYLTLRTQEPAPGELPAPVPPATLDDGPHLNYAGQWFIFATLTLIVYPLLLRRNARHRAADADPVEGAPPSGDGLEAAGPIAAGGDESGVDEHQGGDEHEDVVGTARAGASAPGPPAGARE